MNKIICPHCKKEFELTEADYLSIVSQVKDREFEKEVAERTERVKKEQEYSAEIAYEKMRSAFKEQLSAIKEENAKLSASLFAKDGEKRSAVAALSADKDREIAKLQRELDVMKASEDGKIREAVQEYVAARGADC